jgi:acetyltransferase-like isoleucine patch superfamily enzyme
MDNIFFDLKKLKYLGTNCIIGKTVRIRKPEECMIGDNTIIDDFTYISCTIEIGTNCHIASNVALAGGSGKFKMGNFSTLSNNCTVHCASSDYSKFSLDLPSVPKELQYGGVVEDITVGDEVVIGAHSCILPGVVLPNGVACGAFSLLKKQIYEPNMLYIGIPARKYKERTR